MMPSASAIGLAMACPDAFALPHLDERHEGQEEGDERHAALEDGINAGDIPEVLTERWPGYAWRSEVAYAIDLATGIGRELGVGIKRGYAAFDLGAFEVPGTADLVGRGPAGELVIVDRKSFDPHVARAAKNYQLRTLALAASRALGVDECQVAIWHEARPMDIAPLDAFDLDAFVHELRALLERVASARGRARDGADLQLSPGSHCRWCPAFHGCPAQRALTAEVATGVAETRVELLMPLGTDEGAREAYEFTQRLRLLLKRLDGALYARASEKPIPLGNGRMFGPREKLGKTKLDGDIAYRVVRDLHGQAVADAAVKRTASQKGIKEALGFVGAKGQVAALERKVMDGIKALGGTSREMSIEVGIYTANAIGANDDDEAPRLASGDE